MDLIVLVDEQDRVVGFGEKMEVHKQGLLHRAFSVFIFRNREQLELLLQRRHSTKYHCPNLWTNTCCSHPRPDEEIMVAAARRLKEEMNIEVELKYRGVFQYIAKFDNGLIENEVDHVFVGVCDLDMVSPNPEEVSEYRWESVQKIEYELRKNPENFTPWFGLALDLALEDREKQQYQRLCRIC